ncbi:hypothetical protein [Cupriavidus metallidurans]|uniref:hypothetical protein n=1 Tax=Cupriavidus metallidurans TaxID=119219 RepID=UPI0035C68953
MQTLNLVACAIVFVGAFWALYTRKVETRTGGTAVLALIAMMALGNMASPHSCHSTPEVGMNVAEAIAVLWAFWQIELRHILRRESA